jgi:hypothetical protein
MTPLKKNVLRLLVSLCTSLGLALGLMVGTALAAITSYSAANDETSVFYRLQYTGTYSFYRVYIDTDQSAATGFQTSGLSANYLLENSSLFRYTGTGTTWSWSFVKSVSYSNAAGVAQWTVARADIGETATPNAASLLFQVEAPLESSPPYTHTYSGGAASGMQQLAIPSYFYPGPLWTQLQGGAPTVGLAIINPSSGPGTSLDLQYATTTQTTQQQGILVLGYVYTAYGTRAAQAVMADIDTYYAWYGVDGIFLDETSANCAQQSYYLNLYNYVKGKGEKAKVVLNPGTLIPECYITAGDILITFEDTYTKYLNWHPSGWESKYPHDRFWHLVHTTTQADMPNAIALSKSRQVGWIYVTPDVLPNPWDTLPAGTYWTDELYRASH